MQLSKLAMKIHLFHADVVHFHLEVVHEFADGEKLKMQRDNVEDNEITVVGLN